MRSVEFAKAQIMKTRTLAPGRRAAHPLAKSASMAGLWRSGYFLKPEIESMPHAPAIAGVRKYTDHPVRG
jgi:hypothetical protein